MAIISRARSHAAFFGQFRLNWSEIFRDDLLLHNQSNGPFYKKSIDFFYKNTL